MSATPDYTLFAKIAAIATARWHESMITTSPAKCCLCFSKLLQGTKCMISDYINLQLGANEVLCDDCYDKTRNAANAVFHITTKTKKEENETSCT